MKGKLFKKIKTKDDLEYDGYWFKGKRSGYGNYTSTAGHTYDGYQSVHLHVFIFDLKANFNLKNTFKSQFNQDEKHGYGTSTWNNGNKYVGYRKSINIFMSVSLLSFKNNF